VRHGVVKTVSRRRWLTVGISSLVLLVALVVVVLPLLFLMNKHQGHVQDAQITYAVGQTLLPLYAELKGVHLPEIPEGMQAESPASIRQDAFDELPVSISALAGAAALEVKGFNPQVHMLEDGKKYMLIELVVQGVFESFQSFLVDLSRMSSFLTLQRVVVRKLELGDEMGVEVWLHVQ
jgi:hypothetical protein